MVSTFDSMMDDAINLGATPKEARAFVKSQRAEERRDEQQRAANLTKVPRAPSTEQCKWFAAGKCVRGTKCNRDHLFIPREEWATIDCQLERRTVSGTCIKGKNCIYSCCLEHSESECELNRTTARNHV